MSYSQLLEHCPFCYSDFVVPSVHIGMQHVRQHVQGLNLLVLLKLASRMRKGIQFVFRSQCSERLTPAGLTKLELSTITGPTPTQYDELLEGMTNLHHLQIIKVRDSSSVRLAELQNGCFKTVHCQYPYCSLVASAQAKSQYLDSTLLLSAKWNLSLFDSY